MDSEIKILYTKTFIQSLKRANLYKNRETICEQIRSKLQKVIDENPDSIYFPDSGAGVGNVFKLRVGPRQGYRAFYYADSKRRRFAVLFIIDKQDDKNITPKQAKKLRIKGEALVNEEVNWYER